ncbi:MAG: spore coat protein CotJB [Lachnospiraceae bacterium]|nr:spore coat protein CotJB [Lachnospiraceae bacterium]
MMTTYKTNKDKLLGDINIFSLFIVDMLEYLDTHPYDSKAIDHIKHYLRLKEQAAAEYAKQYGPLTVSNTLELDNNEWKWATMPMPWVNQDMHFERRD